MNVLRTARRLIGRFRRSERGSYSVETVLIFPLLIFAYAGLMTFFDGFRTLNMNLRASYTIADMLSRETNRIDMTYANGLNSMLTLLTRSGKPTLLRVSQVSYDADNDELGLSWSVVSGGSGNYIVPLTQDTLDTIEDQIPIMADGDVNLVIETYSAFEPFMTWHGFDAFYFENLVVTRPRFAPHLCLEDGVATQSYPCG
ncbi:pilus assembly protein [Psychromarinibacter sp. C21-152]|uniref:Pilus assembly protein n=1 Tax=Psychromarinibacter sediminicola TaxID=3033385 RepID=A0AAE3NPM2_9RHOB|nr:TadE/TadG family type IV pilus assembly protein [Psychromarinibacter sediminicola]MDF0600139.1 pilus assembly protein [Psychromarinibacter sediminicola]